jgi:hypothetical protein
VLSDASNRLHLYYLKNEGIKMNKSVNSVRKDLNVNFSNDQRGL